MNRPDVLPDMVVEKRDSKTAHRVPKPDLSDAAMSEQLQEVIQMNEDAKLYDVRAKLYEDVDKQLEELSWPHTTTNILVKYINEYMPGLDRQEIIDVTKEVFGLSGWDQVAYWVRDDMCSEVFNRMLEFCLKNKQKHKNELGFIDGSGIGYLATFTKNLKINIEKTFDAKYFYKVMRPLEYIYDKYGMDLTKVANHIHPGHYSYPQGHSTKSFTAVQTLDEVFELSEEVYRKLFIGACIFGSGRDGSMIHQPVDTYAAGYNTELKEFKDTHENRTDTTSEA